MSTFQDALTEPADAKPAAPAKKYVTPATKYVTNYVSWFTTAEMSQDEADAFEAKALVAGIDTQLVRYDRPGRRKMPLRPRQPLTQEIENGKQ